MFTLRKNPPLTQLLLVSHHCFITPGAECCVEDLRYLTKYCLCPTMGNNSIQIPLLNLCNSGFMKIRTERKQDAYRKGRGVKKLYKLTSVAHDQAHDLIIEGRWFYEKRIPFYFDRYADLLPA